MALQVSPTAIPHLQQHRQPKVGKKKKKKMKKSGIDGRNEQKIRVMRLNYKLEEGKRIFQHTRSGGVPSQGLFRVKSSHIMTPRLKMSHFSVKGSFRISSGAIHSGVPADEVSVMGT